MFRPGAVTENTGFQMVCQELHAQRIQGRTNGRNLGQNVHAIAILFGHALNAGDLASNPVKPCLDLFLNFYIRYAFKIYPIGVYIKFKQFT